MKVISKNPRDVIPNIMEKDCIEHIVIVVQKTQTHTYICVIERNVERNRYQSSVYRTSNNDGWLNMARSTMIALLIAEYNLFEFEHENIGQRIFILQNKKDVDSFIELFGIKNLNLMERLTEKFQ